MSILKNQEKPFSYINHHFSYDTINADTRKKRKTPVARCFSVQRLLRSRSRHHEGNPPKENRTASKGLYRFLFQCLRNNRSAKQLTSSVFRLDIQRIFSAKRVKNQAEICPVSFIGIRSAVTVPVKNTDFRRKKQRYALYRGFCFVLRLSIYRKTCFPPGVCRNCI